MSVIRLVYKGNGGAVLADYNGKRYNLRAGIPVSLPSDVYNYIINTNIVDSRELVVLPAEGPAEESEEEQITEEPKVAKKPKAKRKK